MIDVRFAGGVNNNAVSRPGYGWRTAVGLWWVYDEGHPYFFAFDNTDRMFREGPRPSDKEQA